MNTQTENMELYQSISENRLAIYSKPRRYFNRDGANGPVFRYLFLVEVIVFLMLVLTAGSSLAQEARSNPMAYENDPAKETANIFNYTTVYNSGKVFINWTARNESSDCIYIIERSSNGRQFESVGVKEGIGTNMELFYSWMDQTPPAGFAYYRVKKIVRDGTQFYSATNTIINQGSSFDPKANYAQSELKDPESDE